MSKAYVSEIRNNIRKVIVGKDGIIDLLLTALLAGGHVLIDDVPGVGKTKLVNALARSINADFSRIQFTPDLQPTDITGIYYYNQKTSDFIFRRGPILANIILADEINRAVPRTQAGLLEAMEERQVSVEGEVFRIQEPFMVIATQNPIELEGTFPLPEAQLDRFLIKIKIGYPKKDEEMDIMERYRSDDPLTELRAVINADEILSIRKEVKAVRISRELLGYIADICSLSRNNTNLRLGISPRGAIALMKASQAYALIQQRDYVLPDDIKHMFPYVAEHRLMLNYSSELNGVIKSSILDGIIKQAVVPVEGVING